ncbi:preprotein translocase subunit SecY [Bacillus thuringiensis]|uniref:preprotein translocase subunit SecY n=1 Tax=Bacillus thuringiensis TaxID=1428 RepID=UPI0021D67C30|nr:preprotein translocase subunit SecY [Bacillus thuringiensis]MCU7667143.1 preprotein translocase subunit SecY [Bacillus thuringiensis]
MNTTLRLFRDILSIKDLRKKIGFVFLMLFLYKVGTYVVVPGIDSSLLDNLSKQGGMLGFANMLSGGALQRFSIFALGIVPYITASIVVQLLQMDVVPKLAEWNKQGEKGKKKTKRLTRYLAIILALVQSFGMAFSFNTMFPGLVTNPTVKTYIIISLVITLGTVILMVMGELIDKKGIGQGMSIMITAGIAMGIPSAAYSYYVTDIQGVENVFIAILKTVLLLIFVALLIVGIIYVQRAERRVSIKYPNQNMGTQTSTLPIKINSAGVIPVIFSVSILMFPTTIAQFFKDSEVAQFVIKYFNYTHPVGMAFYAIMIILFAYFYAFVQMSPEKIAENLKKSGGFIPGIRPGKSTEDYISKILSRLTLIGALFLTFLSITPMIIGKITALPPQIQIGGTSLIIIVGVALDVASRVNSYLIDRKYDSFLK